METREVTFELEGREHRLVQGGAGEAGWVRTLLDDPAQQHVVHLLAGALVGALPGHDWEEVRARLAAQLEADYGCEPTRPAVIGREDVVALTAA